MAPNPAGAIAGAPGRGWVSEGMGVSLKCVFAIQKSKMFVQYKSIKCFFVIQKSFFLKYNHNEEHPQRCRRRRRRNTNRAKPSALLERFFGLVKHGYQAGSRAMVVLTTAALTQKRKDEITTDVVAIVTDLLYKSLHPSPSTGKWTKTGPACDKTFVGYICSLDEEVIKAGLGPISFELGVGEADTEQFDDFQILEMRKTTSKASARCLTSIVDYDEHACIITLCIVDEVFRFLTLIHMKFSSSERPYRPGSPSVLQILARDGRSPIYICLCYLSCLLAGKSRRVQLVWLWRGCRSFCDWRRDYPQDVDRLRRMATAAHATIQRRQRSRLAKFDVQLYCSSDMQPAERVCFFKRFLSYPLHKLVPGIERRYRERLESAADSLVGADRQQRMLELMEADSDKFGKASSAAKASAFPCERLHAVHRKATKCNDQLRHVSSVAASSVNGQANACRTGVVKERVSSLCPLEDDDVINPCDAELASSCSRAGAPRVHGNSAKQLFWFDFRREALLEDTSAAKISNGLREKCRGAWAALPLEAQGSYEKEADATKRLAASNRKLQKRDDLLTLTDSGMSALPALAGPGAASSPSSSSTGIVAVQSSATNLGRALVLGSDARVACHSVRIQAETCNVMALRAALEGDILEFHKVCASSPQAVEHNMDPELFSILTWPLAASADNAAMVQVRNAATLSYPTGLRNAHGNFCRKSTQLPGKDKHSMPNTWKRTVFGTRLSVKDGPKRMIDMEKQLLVLFGSLAKAHAGGKPRLLPSADMFLAIECTSRHDSLPVEPDDQLSFWHLVDGKATHGDNEAVQHIHAYEVAPPFQHAFFEFVVNIRFRNFLLVSFRISSQPFLPRSPFREYMFQ